LATAEAFRAGAEKCLLAVRDDRENYDQARPCAALKALSQAYIDNGGGFTEDEELESRLAAEEGRTMAWMARAISASDNPTIRLW
jgi:multimeric flavodoxin WrbA